MTEGKFTELVNLYLDKEISERGLAELKAELAQNAVRKSEFRQRCQLHQAMRMALNPDAHTATFPRWVMDLGTGLAACFALGFALFLPVFRDTAHVPSPSALNGVGGENLVEADPLDQIGRSELRRFATIQEQRSANQRASIAARLRLMGLRPELTPEAKQLRSVSMASIQLPISQRNHAEMLREMQEMTPIPAPQILRAESLQPVPAVGWPSGFQSSLASFE